MTNILSFITQVVDMTKSDNLLAEFSSLVDATECAVEIHRGLKTKNGGLPDKPSNAALPFDSLRSDSEADFYFSTGFLFSGNAKCK